MLGSVMKFKAIDQPSGFIGFKRPIKGRRRMGVQVIHHNDNLLSLWVDHIRKITHRFSPIFASALVSDFDMPLACQRLEEHKHVGDPFPLVLVIYPLRLAWLHGKRFLDIGQQLFTGLIHAHLRLVWVIGLGIHLQNVFHIANKLGAGFRRYAIFLFQPRLNFFFLSVVRIVSCETLSTISNFTKRSCKSRKLQCSYPSGAALHARAIKWASAFPSRQCSYTRFGFWRSRAFSNPPSTNAFRTLATVSELTSNASQMAA